MEEQKNKEELAEDLLKTLRDIESETEVEKMVKDNKIEFEMDNIVFRVRKPTYEEQSELEKFRRMKYLEYLQDKSMMFRKQWAELYKEKGIDINDYDKKMFDIQGQIDNLMIRLAQTSNEQDVEILKTDIMKLKSEQAMLNIEKTDFLSYSIEDQLMIAVNSYYTYLVLEVQKEDKWERLFANYEDFKKSDKSKIINKAFYFVNYLIYSIAI